MSTRAWYVSPFRIIPGDPVPGLYVSRYGGFEGPPPELVAKLRGPFPKCGPAVEVARTWREDEGRRSELYLILVIDGHCRHCNLYEPGRASTPEMVEKFADFAREVQAGQVFQNWPPPDVQMNKTLMGSFVPELRQVEVPVSTFKNKNRLEFPSELHLLTWLD